MATRSVTDSVSGAPAPVSRRGVIGTDEIGGLWDLVEQSAQLRPELVILADDHGRSLTAAQFRDAAENAAAGLAERGVAAGDVVSWQLPTTLEAAVLMAACARLGAVQNPIIALLREREVEFMLEQVGTTLLIVPESWKGYRHADIADAFIVRHPDRHALVLDFDFGSVDAGLRIPVGDPAKLPPPLSGSDDPRVRWIYYTSGTTAAPKGVKHTDRSVIASSNGITDGQRTDTSSVLPIPWPLAHIGGVAMLSAALRTGCRLVLFDTWDPAVTPYRMAAHGGTNLGSAMPFFHAYIAAQRAHGNSQLFPNLRGFIAGGAPTPQEVQRELREVFGVNGAVVDAWGMTEFPVATSQSFDDPDVGRSVGPPMPGVQVRIVDGELRLKGPQLFSGYIDESLNTGALDDDGWLCTGDLGSIDDLGHIHIDGRRKDIIIRNAENISAGEVEEVILTHSAVADASVIGLPDSRTGERTCAIVVLAPGSELTLDALSTYCHTAGLARFKCPEQLEFTDTLPRLPMGKVNKAALRERFSPVGSPISPDSS